MKAAILKTVTSRKFWIAFNQIGWGVNVGALALQPYNPVPMLCALFHTTCIASLVQIEEEEE